jgi:ssDNA-binding Zn-finger/Zn-ribbon topoisomerase 1
MPLNLATIGCIVLLGGRENEIENSSSDESERHTRDTLLQEAKELGIGSADFLESALQDMIEKGYYEVDTEDRFLSRQPTITMTRLLDRIFPRMRGINLLAFIGQTIEEAVTGRTDIEAAISRFDQTLQHHGVPFSKEKSVHTVTTSTDQQNVHRNREQILSKLYNVDKTSQQHTRPSLRVLSRGSMPGHAEIKEVFPKKKSSSDRRAQKQEPFVEDVFNTTECKFPEEGKINTTEEERICARSEETALLNRQEIQQVFQDEKANNGRPELLPEMEENTLLIADTCQDNTIVTDDTIADKIATFESDLALICPICHESTLNEQTTAAGKVYYTCPSESCNFISWGKPHHIECRRCKNPFLVEVTDATGKTILKCPRATCQHRQDLNPTRKLVRKRLVRRRT